MIYEIGYTRNDALKVLWNNKKGKKAVEELNLAEIAKGSNTLIWRKLKNGFYVLLGKRNQSASNRNERTIPIVYGIVMDDEEAVKLISNKEEFFYACCIVQKMPYEYVSALERHMSYKTLEDWFKEVPFNKMQKKCLDDQLDFEDAHTINEAFLSYLIEGRTVYLSNPVNFGTLLTLMESYPDCIRKNVSFSYPYGGTAAGIMQVNFGVDDMFDPTADGFPVTRYVTDNGLEQASDSTEAIAEELYYSAMFSKYNEYVKSLELPDLIDTQKFINKWRRINQALKCDTSVEQYDDFIQNNREEISSVIPFIEMDGISTKFLDFITVENDMKDSYQQGKSDAEMVEDVACYLYRENKKSFSYPPILECGIYMLIFVSALLLAGMIHCNCFEIIDTRNIRIILEVTKRDAALLFLLQVIFMSFWAIVKKILGFFIEKIKRIG